MVMKICRLSCVIAHLSLSKPRSWFDLAKRESKCFVALNTNVSEQYAVVSMQFRINAFHWCTLERRKRTFTGNGEQVLRSRNVADFAIF
jgi:hypothetical protein